MLKRKRLGRDIFMRGMKGRVKSTYNTTYNLKLYDVLKTYSSIIMQKDFKTINIPKLPVLTTEDGIKIIKSFIMNLSVWKNIDQLIPEKFNKLKNLKRSGKAGLFAGSLELVKEGNLLIKQDKLFDEIFIKQK
jgi:segregation and condensation protein A